MSRGSRDLLAVLGVACVAVAALSAVPERSDAAAGIKRAPAVTYTGAFEFERGAARGPRSDCRAEGIFGEVKRGSRVTISEQDNAGDFHTLGKGKVARGKFVPASSSVLEGEEVCRMAFRVKARVAPAIDSVVWLDLKGVFFNIRFPAADVTSGDLGTWTCGFSDDSCATVVGGD